MEFVRRVVSVILVSLWVLSVNGTEVKALKPCKFQAIYNFGDSNSDTGGIAAAFYPMAAPCGETFFHKPAGRGSDGRLMIDFIAKQLRLPYLSPYLDSIGTNFRHGANFATGGSTIRRPNSTTVGGISPFSLDIQTEHFNQFKARTTDLYNQANIQYSQKSRLPRPKDFSKALYIFDIGQNDLAQGFENMNHKQLRASIPDMVNQLATSVQQLYDLGARTFWIHNTGPIGCLPQTLVTLHSYTHKRKPGHFDQNGCVKHQNDIAIEFNRQLKSKVIKLRSHLPHAALTYVDVYAGKYGLISNAKQQGFVKAERICCGFHENGIHVYCSQTLDINGTQIFGDSCKDPSRFISWDGVHYTEAANRWIANHIINGSLSDPPIPITNACYKRTRV